MRTKSITIALACLCAISASGQINVSNSMQDAINKALEKNTNIQNKNIEVEKIAIEQKSVRNKYIPRLEASANYMYFDNQLTIDLPTGTIPIINQPIFDGKSTFDNNGNIFNAGVLAKMVLFSGFQIENGAKALEQKKIGTQFLSEAEKENIIKEVIHSFDLLQLLNESEKLIVSSEKRLETESKRVRRAIDEGLAIPYDRDKIKLASLELRSKRIELEGKRNVLYQKIHYLTGYSENEIRLVENNLVLFEVSENLTIENKQELKALEAFKRASDYMVKKEKNAFLPVVGAFGGLSYNSLFNASMTGPGTPLTNTPIHAELNQLTLSPNWIVGVALKWEIFDGLERKHKIHEAQLNSIQIQNQLDDSKEKLNLLLANNLSNYRIQNQQYNISIEKEKVASHNLNLAEKQYREGLIDISQRLEAENEMVQASTGKIKALVDQRVAALEALSVSGILTKTVLQ